MPRNERCAFFGALVAALQAAFPLEHRPSVKVVLSKLRKNSSEVDLAIAQRAKASHARNPGLITAVNSLAAARAKLRIFHVKHLDSRVIDIDEFQIVELLQHEMAGIKKDIAALVAAKPVEKHLEGHSVVEVLAGMNFETEIHTNFIEFIQDRPPALCELIEGRVYQSGRTLRPGIEVGPRQSSRKRGMRVQPEIR